MALLGIMLLILLLVFTRDMTRAQVPGASSIVRLGNDSLLPCKLTLKEKENLEQISWQRKTREKPQTDFFLTVKNDNEPKFVNGNDRRFKFIGDFNTQNGTLLFSGVELQDEGTYTCVFSVFPRGAVKVDIPLTVYVPPSTNLTNYQPKREDDKEVSLVTCSAALSKPPSQVLWQTDDLKGENVTVSNETIQLEDDLTNTTSTLIAKPTRKLNGRSVRCVIFHEGLNLTKVLNHTIQVYFTPVEVKISQRADGFLCEAEANPAASITWSRNDKNLYSEGGTLELTSKTPNGNGLYECRATNDYGTRRSTLSVFFLKEESFTGWILFGLLLTFTCAFAALFALRTYKCISLNCFSFLSRGERREGVPTDEGL